MGATRKPATLPDCHLESALLGQGFSSVAGVDEAGRGPLAGPVVAAAVILDSACGLSPSLAGLDDSKRLSSAQRQRLFVAIRSVCVAWGTGLASPFEIDRINILQASLLAMSRAVEALPTAPGFLLVDGRDLPPLLPCPARPVIRGDAVSASIAAASIIAKVTRDALLTELALAYPGYGWETNRGYPTLAHRQALLRLGVTEHHRRSFAPVRAALEARRENPKSF